MSDLQAAAQQALEALHNIEWHGSAGAWMLDDCKVENAIHALRAALAEPGQEPVAWMVYTLDGKSVCVTDNPADFTEQHKALPLYTAPVQRKPLTGEEIQELSRQHKFDSRMEKFVRIIEAAHGIKDA